MSTICRTKHLFLFFLIFFLFLSGFVFAGGKISVLSWNLENFGRSKKAETIAFIAQTVKPYDILAIQEVVGGSGGVAAVNRLVNELNSLTPGSPWKATISNRTTGLPDESERYAFIWNQTRVRLIGTPYLYAKYASVISREPYLATFVQAKDTFTLVSLHAVPKKKIPEQEIKYLKFIPGELPHNRLIFMGDFNTPYTNNVFNPLRKQGYFPALVNQKTTLKMKCVGSQCLANAYDNFYYDSKRIKKISSGIIPFYTEFQDMKLARKVSDHVPVLFTFMIP